MWINATVALHALQNVRQMLFTVRGFSHFSLWMKNVQDAVYVMMYASSVQ
jgi:hypothetical protein